MRCPNGTRKNKKTNKCEEVKQQVKEQPMREIRKPCPKGTRKDKNGQCEPMKQKSVKQKQESVKQKQESVKQKQESVKQKQESVKQKQKSVKQENDYIIYQINYSCK